MSKINPKKGDEFRELIKKSAAKDVLFITNFNGKITKFEIGEHTFIVPKQEQATEENLDFKKLGLKVIADADETNTWFLNESGAKTKKVLDQFG